MGTFIYEAISKDNPFRDEIKEELQRRVIEILLEFGECAIENIELYGKKINVYDHGKLLKKDDNYILAYNRFEKDTWEPAFLNVSLENFSGVRQWGIGSKVGWRQHYMAMAVSRVLCECYSDGNYIVCGDIGTSTMFNCLSYIGKKYGFELVRKCVECRTNLSLLKDNEYWEELFWGIRGYNFYFYKFQKMNFDEWIVEMRRNFFEDIENVKEKNDYKYCGTVVYLASLLMKNLCEKDLADKLELDKAGLLVELRSFVQKYYIDFVEMGIDNISFPDMDFSQYPELNEFKTYFETMENYHYWRIVCDKYMFCKSVNNILDTVKRADSEEIKAEFQKMLDDMIPSEEDVEKLQNHRGEWHSYYSKKSMLEQLEYDYRNAELMEKIQKYAECSNDIRSNLISDVYLRELMLNNKCDEDISEELNVFLTDIFSAERQARFNEVVFKTGNCNKENIGIKKLINMADELMKGSDILFSSELFYKLLEHSFSKEGEILIDKVGFYLNDLPDQNQKEAFLWVIQDEKLCQKYGFELN